MTSVQSPSVLHDRATRGETFSPAEKTTLDAWYADNEIEQMRERLAPPLPRAA